MTIACILRKMRENNDHKNSDRNTEFHFCNKERFEDKPYCLDHCAVAYVIPEKEDMKPVAHAVNTRYK